MLVLRLILVIILGSAAQVGAQTGRRVVVLKSPADDRRAQLLLQASGVVLHQTTTDFDGSGTISGCVGGGIGWRYRRATSRCIGAPSTSARRTRRPFDRSDARRVSEQRDRHDGRGMVADIERAWLIVTVRDADDFAPAARHHR